MEAWLSGHGESGHYLELNIFSVEIFSAEIFTAEIFTAEIFAAEPSLRSLHCGTFTANSHCGSPARKLSFSASIEKYGLHMELHRKIILEYHAYSVRCVPP